MRSRQSRRQESCEYAARGQAAGPVAAWRGRTSCRTVAQAVHGEGLGLGQGLPLRAAAEAAVGIRVVNDVDLVAAAHEGKRNTTHILSVTAKTVWRVERRDHRDAQGPSRGYSRSFPMQSCCIVGAGHGACRFVVSALAWAADKSARSRKGALNT